MPPASPTPATAPDSSRALSREEVARREVGHTEVRPAVAGALVLFFLFIVVVVPLVQLIHESGRVRATTTASGLPGAMGLVPQLLDAARGWDGSAGLWTNIRDGNRRVMRAMTAFEDELEDESLLVRVAQPRMQALLARVGAGNEKAYLGRGGWLFYRADVDYLTGPGFLDPAWHARRQADAGAPVATDSRKAIIDFRDQLRARGVELLLVPTPVKPMVHPDQLSVNAADAANVAAFQNPSYQRWLADLEAAGVRVFDCMEVLRDPSSSAFVQPYLSTDTHWSPEAMDAVAAALARAVAAVAPLSGEEVTWVRAAREVTNIGDVGSMLRLSAGQSVFREQRVTIHPVTSQAGVLWRPSAGAEVLLLGDSFSNIYSLDGMGWGAGAGLAEQLSYHLRRPVDAILRNDDGAFATRQMLARELARGRDRLAGKRVVVWQFAARELAFGNWVHIALTQGAPRTGGFAVPPAGAQWNARAEVVATSPVPIPGSVPYKDHIVAIHLADLSAGGVATEAGATQAVVYAWSMRDGVLTDAARLRPGQIVEADLRPWTDVAADYERFNRSELDDEALQWEEPCWAAKIKGL